MSDTARNMVWTVAALLAAAYLAGFVIFVLSLPRTPAEPIHADGIVALTGGGARLDTAASLLEEGAGKRLLISGVYPSITKPELQHLLHAGRRFACCADLGFSAMSTRGNAAEAAAWAHAHGYRSLVIVTANYHMPRSLHEFRAEMPGMRLLPYPVEQDDVDVGTWWSDPHAMRVLHLEYAKYLGSLFFGALASGHRDHRRAAEEAHWDG